MPKGVTNIGKILYAIDIELFAFLPALPAAPHVLICSEPAGCVQGTISPNCCHVTVGLSSIQSDFSVALRSVEFNLFYRIWLVQRVYFWHFILIKHVFQFSLDTF